MRYHVTLFSPWPPLAAPPLETPFQMCNMVPCHQKKFQNLNLHQVGTGFCFFLLAPEHHLWCGLSTDFCTAPTLVNMFTEFNRSCLPEVGQHQHQFPTACALSPQYAYFSPTLLLLWDRFALWCCPTPSKRVLGVWNNMFHRAGAVPILIVSLVFLILRFRAFITAPALSQMGTQFHTAPPLVNVF